MLKILKSELRWYLHARACLLLACLLACIQQLLASNCESCWWVQVPLYASGKDTRIIWAHMGNIQGESVHRVISCFPHGSSKIPSPSPPNPPAVLERLFVQCLRSQEMCARSPRKCIWGPKKCVGGLKKWVWWGLPKKCGCRGLKTCVQGFKKFGCEVSPKKCVWGPKKLGVRSPPRNVYEVPRNMCKASRNVILALEFKNHAFIQEPYSVKN
jgi:hypothetical protein